MPRSWLHVSGRTRWCFEQGWQRSAPRLALSADKRSFGCVVTALTFIVFLSAASAHFLRQDHSTRPEAFTQSRLIIWPCNRNSVAASACRHPFFSRSEKRIGVVQILRIMAYSYLDDGHFVDRSAIGDEATDQRLEVVRDLNRWHPSLLLSNVPKPIMTARHR